MIVHHHNFNLFVACSDNRVISGQPVFFGLLMSTMLITITTRILLRDNFGSRDLSFDSKLKKTTAFLIGGSIGSVIASRIHFVEMVLYTDKSPQFISSSLNRFIYPIICGVSAMAATS